MVHELRRLIELHEAQIVAQPGSTAAHEENAALKAQIEAFVKEEKAWDATVEAQSRVDDAIWAMVDEAHELADAMRENLLKPTSREKLLRKKCEALQRATGKQVGAFRKALEDQLNNSQMIGKHYYKLVMEHYERTMHSVQLGTEKELLEEESAKILKQLHQLQQENDTLIDTCRKFTEHHRAGVNSLTNFVAPAT
ncbi:hypothetical protein EJ06DRAFT_531239 [Trichodelitschia bisporula]|uniref:Uncharacterized protein n=1 Tax=Trichodelitschia bisporula TaxID=703511 RepID=A0A6G1HV23_9PEZI|nr:hypothetical protein EJ06DRAFT_531239 [Trichodelitschia bisporula]